MAMTPIDFGKEFLYTLYRIRKAEDALQFLAEDLVWVTPDEILHLKTKKSSLDFLNRSIAENPTLYNVDVASIKSAVASDDTNTVVYDVNLVPAEVTNTVNMRCSLTIHKSGASMELVFVGMSRRYEKPDTDAIPNLLNAFPGGLMVLNCMSSAEPRLLHSNGYFPQVLGYGNEDCQDRMDRNPFFMMSEKDEKRLRALVTELTKLKKPRNVAMQVGLLTKDGKEISHQVSLGSTHKSPDGSRTILYLIFVEITDLLRDCGRVQKKEIEAALVRQRENAAIEEKQRREMTQKMYEDAEARLTVANSHIEEIDKMIEAAAKATDAVRKEAEERIERERKAHEEDKRAALLEQKQKAAEKLEEIRKKNKEKTDDLEARVRALQEKLDDLREKKNAGDKAYEDRILKLEFALTGTKKEAEEKIAEETKRLEKENEEAIAEVRAEAQREKERFEEKREELKAEAEGAKEGYLSQIARLRDEIIGKEQAIRKLESDGRITVKEKDKSIERLYYLLSGQMRHIQDLADSFDEAESRMRQKELVDKIGQSAGLVPGMCEDLLALSKLNVMERNSSDRQPFALSDCIGTVRKVIKPQCRKKGIIFSCETNGTVPDKVIGNKTGLQLAFFCILENAVAGCANGGKIMLEATADPPVRDRAYFHFAITDTGTGIADDRLPHLFDNPESELSIARKVISMMGGSIQVRSAYGKGSRFEISVNLRLG